jgi:hypothetical protein
MLTLTQPGQIPLPGIDMTLGARERTHGNFRYTACLAQEIKTVMRQGQNWERLSPCQCEALDQIASKIARVLSGDPRHEDHWRDIQGYSHLAEKTL